MKKLLVLIVLVFAITMVGCAPKRTNLHYSTQIPPRTVYYGEYTKEECEGVWEQLDVDPGDETTMVNLVLNTKHAPDSVGATLEECIMGGWVGWR